MPPTKLPVSQDEWLADFTDRVLNGHINELPAMEAGPEMHRLAETILQLKNAFPEPPADAVSVRRVQARVMTHAREAQQQRERWGRLMGGEWLMQKRPRLAIATALTLLLVVMAGAALVNGEGTMVGSAGTGGILGWVTWIMLGLLIAGIFWLTRRK
ncbi:MAG: hypothetical protein HFACDABA_02276 [Anaerolineales bacterium]|nr:hypothetical protein [Anaerolineales bacterium]